MTIAEKRKAENLPFIEGTDRIFLNTATMPLDLIDARVQAVLDLARERGTMPGGSSDGLTTLSHTSVRTVMGRLSGATKVADLDPLDLVEGLDPGGSDTVMVLHALHYSDPDLSGFKSALKAREAT